MAEHVHERVLRGIPLWLLRNYLEELGGTDAMIVLDDADLPAAADAVVQGRLTNGAGQICCAVKRVFVQETIREQFLAILLKRVSAIKMGDPSSEETDLGPLITPARYDGKPRARSAATLSPNVGVGAGRSRA